MMTSMVPRPPLPPSPPDACPDSPSLISLPEDYEADVGRLRSSAKRSKVVGGGGTSRPRANRLQQNREAARKSRLRKKSRERELQQNVAFYTRSNDTLKKQNQQLQQMLDAARSKVAQALSREIDKSAINDEDVKGSRHITSSPLPAVENSAPLKHSSLPETETSNGVDADEACDDGCDYIDLLLENDDWLDNDNHGKAKASSVSEISDDDGCDYIDMLLDNDGWLNENDEATATATVHQPRQAQVVSPILSFNPTFNPHNDTESGQSKLVATHEDRLEKNRKAAQKRRRKKKAEHERLKQSVAFYTQSNDKLKKQNEELQMMILQARSKVAETPMH